MRLIHSNLPILRRPHSSQFHNRGVTLVEILVTVLVTSVGLLGIAALHLTSLRNNYDASTRTQASMLASDIADRMRSNRSVALLGSYDIGTSSTYATPTTRAENDIAEWKTALGQLLPAGDGSVAVNTASHIATIVVSWTERGTGVVTFRTLTEL